MSLLIRNLTRRAIPRLRYNAIVGRVFGKNQQTEISLAFVSPARSRVLNRTYRGKNRPANILTFPLTHDSGEILICLATARAEARRVGLPFPKYLQQLFIHGLLHLKGCTHGSRMEKLELWVEQSLPDWTSARRR
ncbi:MAG: rRNA maturation RNase YbeY [Patescibacteria group bacterium]